jgi:hypothetical protein
LRRPPPLPRRPCRARQANLTPRALYSRAGRAPACPSRHLLHLLRLTIAPVHHRKPPPPAPPRISARKHQRAMPRPPRTPQYRATHPLLLPVTRSPPKQSLYMEDRAAQPMPSSPIPAAPPRPCRQ